MVETVKQLIKISQSAGARVDYTQGGGGNTSVKLDNLMLIKASGFKLTDITENSGYVAVNRDNILCYYNSVNTDIIKDYERESSAVTAENIVVLDDVMPLRPSVEVGFHALLQKLVIHTHSVYANVLTCCKEGEKLAQDILSGIPYIFLPYINPGFNLTVEMRKAIKAYEKKHSIFPQVIFMKNHGLVVTASSEDEVIRIHDLVNDKIKKFLSLPQFPQISIEKSDDSYISKTTLVAENLSLAQLESLDQLALYPDQLVYLNNTLKLNPHKITITDSVKYNTSISEATTMDETLAAYIYVIKAIQERGLSIMTMSAEDKFFIDNWESEKYRKSLIK